MSVLTLIVELFPLGFGLVYSPVQGFKLESSLAPALTCEYKINKTPGLL
jgi:hypothetical protein